MGLERRLEKLGVPFEKHNIWEDAEAAAVVRSIANGNETVPTVVIGEARLVNPSADAVLAPVRQHAPHLDPGDPPQGSLRRFLDRSEEHTSELQSLMRIPYAVFRSQKKTLISTSH